MPNRHIQASIIKMKYINLKAVLTLTKHCTRFLIAHELNISIVYQQQRSRKIYDIEMNIPMLYP